MRRMDENQRETVKIEDYNPILNLPDEILMKIIGYLSPKEASILRKTCSYLYNFYDYIDYCRASTTAIVYSGFDKTVYGSSPNPAELISSEEDDDENDLAEVTSKNKTCVIRRGGKDIVKFYRIYDEELEGNLGISYFNSDNKLKTTFVKCEDFYVTWCNSIYRIYIQGEHSIFITPEDWSEISRYFAPKDIFEVISPGKFFGNIVEFLSHKRILQRITIKEIVGRRCQSILMGPKFIAKSGFQILNKYIHEGNHCRSSPMYIPEGISTDIIYCVDYIRGRLGLLHDKHIHIIKLCEHKNNKSCEECTDFDTIPLEEYLKSRFINFANELNIDLNEIKVKHKEQDV